MERTTSFKKAKTSALHPTDIAVFPHRWSSNAKSSVKSTILSQLLSLSAI